MRCLDKYTSMWKSAKMSKLEMIMHRLGWGSKGKSFAGRMDLENTEQISKTKTGATHSSIQTITLNFCLQLCREKYGEQSMHFNETHDIMLNFNQLGHFS